MKLIGRQEEIKIFNNLRKKKGAQLVVCLGRRRIGKSFLIRHVGKTHTNYLEIQGSAPSQHSTNQDQINSFMRQFCEQTQFPFTEIKDWDTALRMVGKYYENKPVFIFLDEISWMGGRDPLFTSTLKLIWDTLFIKNTRLILVLCGSVSSWIEDNILKSTHFVGRISTQITLKELPLGDSLKFFKKNTSKAQVLKYLLVTGGVPRYLEEVRNYDHPNKALFELLLKTEGFLYNEYDRIFFDIFGKKQAVYLKIIKALSDGVKTFSEISSTTKLSANGKLSIVLHHLIIGGFVRKDDAWSIDKQKMKRGDLYRISDNYLRFYQKAITPLRKKIENNQIPFKTFDLIPQLNSIMGYQFENLIYNNFNSLLKILEIDLEELVNWGPYFQTKTLRQEACQIDLLIHTKNILYLFEIKFRPCIDSSVIRELKTKQGKLKYSRATYSLRTGIIYSHEVDKSLIKKKDADYFISFNDFLRD